MAILREQILAKRKSQQTQDASGLEEGEIEEDSDLEEGEIKEDSDVEDGEIRAKRPKVDQKAFARMLTHHLGGQGKEN